MLRRFASHPRCTLHRSGLSNLNHIAADTVQRLINMLGRLFQGLGQVGHRKARIVAFGQTLSLGNHLPRAAQ